MGVALAALAALALLAVGAPLARWMELQLLPAGAEAGAAAVRDGAAGGRPRAPDPWLYAAGPVVALLGVVWAIVVIPFDRHLIPADLTIGLFYFIVVVDFVVLGVALSGWGANTPNAVESCYRVVAQLVAYVVPLGLAILGPIMMARSLSTVEIVEAQRAAGLWYVVAQPQGFALYVATALMQSYRAPFLEPFADRIDRGPLGVCGGWRRAIWHAALAGLLFVVSAMGAVLFFGGYGGPWLPGPVWMAIKTAGVALLMLWAGRRMRLRSTADMLALSWKVLIPVGLGNVLVVGALILLGVGQAPFE